MAIALRAAEPQAADQSVMVLAERLAALGAEAVPLLVFRLPALERTAWRDGRRAARSVERRANAAFSTAVARVLRAEDLFAHDSGSDAFIAALVAPTRGGPGEMAPVDIRSALARIATTVEALTRLDVDAGWTRFDTRSGTIASAIARALVRGAQERERYAFFSAVGHELRTPLSSIRGYLETLMTDDIDATTQRRFVTIAYNESMRLTRLLEGMFEISLLDLSATFPMHASGALEIAMGAALDACAGLAAARGIRISVDALEPTPVAIDGDRLTLVLINLIDNAIKHGRASGEIRISVQTSHPRLVMIAVDDDGPGVPLGERERVFALGERGATRASGSGIGLALVRMMLERVGGRAEVSDAPIGGARFTAYVPRRGAV